MRPEVAVRQLEYAVASRLDDDRWGHWEAATYRGVFERLCEQGAREHSHAVIEHICGEVRDGYRPKPEDVHAHAESLVKNGRRLAADGGEK
jgi:hypothetical protein